MKPAILYCKLTCRNLRYSFFIEVQPSSLLTLQCTVRQVSETWEELSVAQNDDDCKTDLLSLLWKVHLVIIIIIIIISNVQSTIASHSLSYSFAHRHPQSSLRIAIDQCSLRIPLQHCSCCCCRLSLVWLFPIRCCSFLWVQCLVGQVLSHRTVSVERVAFSCLSKPYFVPCNAHHHHCCLLCESTYIAFDYIKSQMQTELGKTMYKNGFDVLSHTLSTNPLLLFKGVGIQVLGNSPKNGIRLGINDFIRGSFMTHLGYFPLWGEVVSACLAGACLVCTRMEWICACRCVCGISLICSCSIYFKYTYRSLHPVHRKSLKWLCRPVRWQRYPKSWKRLVVSRAFLREQKHAFCEMFCLRAFVFLCISTPTPYYLVRDGTNASLPLVQDCCVSQVRFVLYTLQPLSREP